MSVTDISTLSEKYGAREIALPGWEKDDTFICRVKRPTFFNLAASGQIPNPLLGVIQDMFVARPDAVEKIALDKQASAMISIARYALVEPTYDEIIAAGLTLTDDQLLYLYAFAIGGAKALETFRQGKRRRSRGNVANIRNAPEPVSGDK